MQNSPLANTKFPPSGEFPLVKNPWFRGSDDVLCSWFCESDPVLFCLAKVQRQGSFSAPVQNFIEPKLKKFEKMHATGIVWT